MTSRSALLLIDFQRDFLDDNGRMPIARNQVEPLIAETNQAIAAARAKGIEVLGIGNEFSPRDWFMNTLRRNAALAGSDGAAWDDRIPLDGAPYFTKTQGDAFSNEQLKQHLRDLGTEEVILTGLQSKACVMATARGAIKEGLRVRILERAVADTSDGARERALRRLAAIPGVSISEHV
jgi:nicotinamidase-related amidase